MTGAQFEIRIDHTPRTYRDRKDFAMEAASFLKSRNPHSVVEVKDLKEWRGDGRRLQSRLMALTMRPAGLSSGIDQDREDYTVFCGEWNIGRIYEVRGCPEHLRWFWALHFPSKPENLRTDNRVATLEAAKAEFEASWEAWKAWARMEEVP